ncbi:hypothetical protein MO973_13195 [Paenibacillus sp. TRM 82003]|nr:hypothetical protein [Paenibacillus sp. TRM 82003]
MARSWFLGDVVYSYVYVKSGSLTVAAVTHGIHNVLNELVLGHAENFALLEVNRYVLGSEKMLYEAALKTTLIVVVIIVYRRTGGLFAPASALSRLWGK